jgi:two-component system, response regulator PdtaR
MMGAVQTELASQSAPVVLLVEDEILIRLDLALRLREMGYVVIEAGTGDQALGALQTRDFLTHRSDPN